MVGSLLETATILESEVQVQAIESGIFESDTGEVGNQRQL